MLSYDELFLLLCIVQDDTIRQREDLAMCQLHSLDAAKIVKTRIDKNESLEKKLKQMIKTYKQKRKTDE